MNKVVSLSFVKEIIKNHLNGDEKNVLNNILYLFEYNSDLGELLNSFLKDIETTWEEMKDLGCFLSILYDYAIDDYLTQSKLIDYATKCMLKSFMLSPIKEKHGIAYEYNNLIKKTYHQYVMQGDTKTTYSSILIDHYELEWKYEPEDDMSIIHSWGQRTIGLRYTCLMQRYLFTHIQCFNKINGKTFFIDDDYIKKCDYNLQGITKKELKKVARKMFANIFLEVVDDQKNFYPIGNDGIWELTRDNKIRLIEINEVMDLAEQSYRNNNIEIFDEENDKYNGLGSYVGSYAQDEMGYSDDDIDTVFDGDPDAYWNID